MSFQFERVAGPFKGRAGGLAWDGAGMLFSAVQEERIMRFDPKTGRTQEVRRATGRINGLAIAKDGSIYAAQEGGRRIVRLLSNGSTVTAPDELEGKHHNQPTDVFVDAKGRVWFTDPYNAQPPYGPPVFPMLDHASVLRLDPERERGGRLTRVTHDTHGPRAVLVSADGKTLFVADGDMERGDMCQLFSYPLQPDGSAGTAKALISFAPMERGIEGMCFDSEGNILACAGWKKAGLGPQIHVITQSGTIVESHPAPADMPMRCAFGDADLSSLYVTAGDGCLYRATNTARRGMQRDQPVR